MSGPRTGWRRRVRRRGRARAVILAAVVFASVLPLAWTIFASVGIHPNNTSTPPTWTLAPTLDAYREVGTAERGFWDEMAASAATSAASTLVTILIAFLAAYAFVHSTMRRKALLMQGFLVLASLPVMAYAIPLEDTVRALGLHDTFAGLVLTQAAIFAPLAVYVLYGYLSEASFDFEEAARLDGASPWRTISQVVLPMNAPGVVATAIVIFVLCWNSFLAPLVVTTSRVRTIPLAMSDFFTVDRELEWPSAAAALVVTLLPLAAVVALSHRTLRRFLLGRFDIS
ncbi:MAG TPA: carbohydrate ABC transporter permease [Spirochaetia bacterium]|nr:carbohydrate ABC transporter permease [Spirochaetia bacterium]